MPSFSEALQDVAAIFTWTDCACNLSWMQRMTRLGNIYYNLLPINYLRIANYRA
jgi:hypothetical protein